MILPTIRTELDRKDGVMLAELLAGDDPDLRRRSLERLDEEGIDALLDDPRTLNAVLTATGVALPAPIVFYVIARQALLENGLTDPALADYVASVILAFGKGKRAYHISDRDADEYHYLVDMMIGLAGSEGERAFLLRSHIGNFSLWLSGLFPDFVERRVRKGAPGIQYYEAMGSSGYRLAAETPEAERLGVDGIFRDTSRAFGQVRVALNQVADRHLWPNAGDPVGRVLREIGRSSPEPS